MYFDGTVPRNMHVLKVYKVPEYLDGRYGHRYNVVTGKYFTEWGHPQNGIRSIYTIKN